MKALTYAWLAQSVEHETLNLRVVGSSPTSGVGNCYLSSKEVLCRLWGSQAFRSVNETLILNLNKVQKMCEVMHLALLPEHFH